MNYSSTLAQRITPAQRASLEWLAEHLEISEADVVRALLDGITSINGVHLTKTLWRLHQADASAFGPEHVVTHNLPVTRRQKEMA